MAKTNNFESKLKELENIVSNLEAGDLGLEESLKIFEKGVSIYKDCKKSLKDAEKKIKVLNDEIEQDAE
jgi:exodeoxyribonuclease VII small subunit